DRSSPRPWRRCALLVERIGVACGLHVQSEVGYARQARGQAAVAGLRWVALVCVLLGLACAEGQPSVSEGALGTVTDGGGQATAPPPVDAATTDRSDAAPMDAMGTPPNDGGTPPSDAGSTGAQDGAATGPTCADVPASLVSACQASCAHLSACGVAGAPTDCSAACAGVGQAVRHISGCMGLLERFHDC